MRHCALMGYKVYGGGRMVRVIGCRGAIESIGDLSEEDPLVFLLCPAPNDLPRPSLRFKGPDSVNNLAEQVRIDILKLQTVRFNRNQESSPDAQQVHVL